MVKLIFIIKIIIGIMKFMIFIDVFDLIWFILDKYVFVKVKIVVRIGKINVGFVFFKFNYKKWFCFNLGIWEIDCYNVIKIGICINKGR